MGAVCQNVRLVDYSSWARRVPDDGFHCDLLHLTFLGRQRPATIARQVADEAAGELTAAAAFGFRRDRGRPGTMGA